MVETRNAIGELEALASGGFQSVTLIDLFPQLLCDIKSNCDSDQTSV